MLVERARVAVKLFGNPFQTPVVAKNKDLNYYDAIFEKAFCCRVHARNVRRAAGRVPDLRGQQSPDHSSWLGTATATSAPLPPLKDLITFTSDGNVIETRRLYLRNSPLGPLVGTPGHGAWVQTTDNEFVATLMVIYEGGPDHPTSPSEVLAVETVRFRLNLDRDANKLGGTLVDEIDDLAGHPIFIGPGTFTAARIVATSP